MGAGLFRLETRGAILVHGLRQQVGPQNVRVLAIAPGVVLNDLWGISDPDEIDRKAAEGLGLRSEDVAEAALFLCSDRAASITGVTLPVDAGWLVQAPYAQYLRGNPIRA